MAELIPIGNLEHLFEVGVLVNGAFAVLSRNGAGPIDDLVKLERKIRSRLKKLDKVEDEDLMRAALEAAHRIKIGIFPESGFVAPPLPFRPFIALILMTDTFIRSWTSRALAM